MSLCILVFKIQNKLLHLTRRDFKYSCLKLIKMFRENVRFHLIVTLISFIFEYNFKHF